MEEIAIAVQERVPVLIWGPPGTGKTSFVRKLAETLDLPIETVIASIREPSDFAGLPIVADGGVRFAPPQWAVRLAHAGQGILFLDEISTAPPAVQAALLRVVLERAVGELELPESVAIIAAANPPDQAAGGWELSPPLANRFCHLEWSVVRQEWVRGFLSGWTEPAPVPRVDPGRREAEHERLRTQFAEFVRARPGLLIGAPRSSEPWPSPRSWEFGLRLLAAARAAGAEAAGVALLGGCVGSGPAFEFLSFLERGDLIDPEAALADPDAFTLPARGDLAMAALKAVAQAVAERPTDERWLAAWKIIDGVAASAPDVALVAARELAKVKLRLAPHLPVPQTRHLASIAQAVGL